MLRLIVWILVGLLAGFLGSKVVYNQSQGFLLDTALGLIGGFVGGIVFKILGFDGKGLIYHIVVATVGAILVLVGYHMLMTH